MLYLIEYAAHGVQFCSKTCNFKGNWISEVSKIFQHPPSATSLLEGVVEKVQHKTDVQISCLPALGRQFLCALMCSESQKPNLQTGCSGWKVDAFR